MPIPADTSLEEVTGMLKAKGLSDSEIPASIARIETRLNIKFKPREGLSSGTKNFLAEMGGQIALDGVAGTVLRNSAPGRVLTGGKLAADFLIRNPATAGPANMLANFFGFGREGESLLGSGGRGALEGTIGGAVANKARAFFKLKNAGKTALENLSPEDSRKFNIPKGVRVSGLTKDLEKNAILAMLKNKELEKFPISQASPPTGQGFLKDLKANLSSKAIPVIKKQVLTFEGPVNKNLERLVGSQTGTSAFNKEFKTKFSQFKINLQTKVSQEFEKLKLTPAPVSEIPEAFARTRKALNTTITGKASRFGKQVKQAFNELDTFFKEEIKDTKFLSEKDINDILELFQPSDNLGSRAVLEATTVLRRELGAIAFGSREANRALKLKNIILGGKDKLPSDLLSSAEQEAANLFRRLGSPKFNTENISGTFAKADPEAITGLGKLLGPDLSKQLFGRLLRTATNTRTKKVLIGDIDNVDDKARVLALIRNFKGAKAEEFLNEVQGTLVLKGIIEAFQTGKPFNALSLPTLLIGSNAVNIIRQVFGVEKLTAGALAGAFGIIFKKAVERGIDFDKLNTAIRKSSPSLTSFQKALVRSTKVAGIGTIKGLTQPN